MTDFSTKVAECLPYLRRYGRALTGSQEKGDGYAMVTLEAILSDRTAIDEKLPVKVALFQCFHAIWRSSGGVISDDEEGIFARAQSILADLTTDTREALLLRTVENFSIREVAQIMRVEPDDVQHLLQIARAEMRKAVSGRVMIIEDEAIIAADLKMIVTDVGHEVTGVARTRSEAVDLGTTTKPDLILADIQLADNSSGIDAVTDLLAELGQIPVIFITAFPERLLTGERPEPAFLISKPYTEDQVQSAVSQAMFFASTETLIA